MLTRNPALAAAHRQFSLPKTYLVVDIETSGFDPNKDLILQVGWAAVIDRRPVNVGSVLLDWTTCPFVEQRWLYDRIEKIERALAARGGAFGISYDRLRQEGKNPGKAMDDVNQLLHWQLARGGCVVGHGFEFDRRMIDAYNKKFLRTPDFPNGYELPWKHGRLIDTGALYLLAHEGVPPQPQDTLDGFQKRAAGLKNKYKWKLSMLRKELMLDERYGDCGLSHDGADDCRAAWALMDTLYTMATHGDEEKEERVGGPDDQPVGENPRGT